MLNIPPLFLTPLHISLYFLHWSCMQLMYDDGLQTWSGPGYSSYWGVLYDSFEDRGRHMQQKHNELHMSYWHLHHIMHALMLPALLPYIWPNKTMNVCCNCHKVLILLYNFFCSFAWNWICRVSISTPQWLFWKM